MRALFLAFGLAFFPLGCGGQNEPVQLDLRVDNTPIQREAEPPVNSYAEILAIARPAVVSVFAQRVVDESEGFDHPAFQRFFGEEDLPRERVQRGVGSGVIVSPQGFLITNNHVIEDAERIMVQMANSGEIEAEVVGSDPATDIAILRIDTGADLPFAVLADSDLIEVGDVVFALGNALGIGHAVTTGIISARGRTGIGILGEEGYEDFIQTDASMNIGNSGGPLVDTRGRVIGINTAIASPGGGNVGIGFAIPINMARDVMENLIRFGEVPRGYLGLTLRDTAAAVHQYGAPGRNGDPVSDGVLVVNVMVDSPAAQAGVEPGDIVVELNGKPVESASNLRLDVARLGPGTNVEIGVIRDGERMDLSAVLGSRDEAVATAPGFQENELLPGLSVTPLTPELRREFDVADPIDGLLVLRVAPGSPYAESIPLGAVIMQINGERVTDLEDARAQLTDRRNLFLFFFEGSFHYVVIDVE